MITKHSYNQFVVLTFFLFSAFLTKAEIPDLIITNNSNGTLSAKMADSREYTIYVTPLFQEVPNQRMIKAKNQFTIEGLVPGEYAIILISEKGEINTIKLIIN